MPLKPSDRELVDNGRKMINQLLAVPYNQIDEDDEDE